MNAGQRVVERDPLVGQERRVSSRCSSATRLTATSISSERVRRVDTLQSEPMASRAPARSSDANGYCQAGPLGPEERDRELVHLGLVAGPVRLRVGDDAERREARDVVGVDDLDVGDVGPRVGPAVGRAGRLDRVERVADGPVADRVEVRLEADRVEPGHRLGEQLGVDEVDARLFAVGRRPRRGTARASRR